MSRGLSRVLGGAVAFALLVLVTLLALLDRPPSETPKSVASVAEDGRRAAFLLLEQLGFEPVLWDERPGLLPRGVLLWLPGVPVDPREKDLEGEQRAREEVLDALDLARAGGLRSPRHYRGFLEQGGRLVAPLSAEMLTFLVEELGLDDLASCSVEALEPLPEGVELGGDQLQLELRDARRLVDLDRDLPREALARTPSGDALALEIPVGRGGLVLLGSDDFLANARLREADHALLLVRLVEALAPAGGVYFDEHALGRWSEEGMLKLALGPDARLASVHLLVLALLALWMLAWPREFPRDPAPVEATAPLERARGQASLALRAERPELLARFLVQGTLQRIARRLRASLDEGLAPREALERLAAAADLPDRSARVARWSAELLDAPVSGRADLARLDAGLRALELALGRSRPSSSAPSGHPENRPDGPLA